MQHYMIVQCRSQYYTHAKDLQGRYRFVERWSDSEALFALQQDEGEREMVFLVTHLMTRNDSTYTGVT
jgi:quinol monooxygenase YgiN